MKLKRCLRQVDGRVPRRHRAGTASALCTGVLVVHLAFCTSKDICNQRELIIDRDRARRGSGRPWRAGHTPGPVHPRSARTRRPWRYAMCHACTAAARHPHVPRVCSRSGCPDRSQLEAFSMEAFSNAAPRPRRWARALHRARDIRDRYRTLASKLANSLAKWFHGHQRCSATA